MELIFGILGGFALGGFFGAFGMAVLSGRAYDKGAKDGALAAYYTGQEDGYRLAIADLAVAERIAHQVVFDGPDKREIEGD